jgi:hypothetical protein
MRFICVLVDIDIFNYIFINGFKNIQIKTLTLDIFFSNKCGIKMYIAKHGHQYSGKKSSGFEYHGMARGRKKSTRNPTIDVNTTAPIIPSTLPNILVSNSLICLPERSSK